MRRKKPFLSGRNGPDALSMTASGSACILLIVAMFLKGTASSVLWLLALICLILCYFRMFSKNIGKRYKEEQVFEGLRYSVTEKFRKFKFRIREKKEYHIYKCPNCGQETLVYQNGCLTCVSCGYSKCG